MLDASINAIRRDYNTTTREFTVDFPYGRIYGIGVCLSENYHLSSDGKLTDNGVTVVGGENNGSYCFCRLTYPFFSKWRFVAPPSYYANSGENCAQHCGGNCTWGLEYDINVRKASFNSIQN